MQLSTCALGPLADTHAIHSTSNLLLCSLVPGSKATTAHLKLETLSGPALRWCLLQSWYPCTCCCCCNCCRCFCCPCLGGWRQPSHGGCAVHLRCLNLLDQGSPLQRLASFAAGRQAGRNDWCLAALCAWRASRGLPCAFRACSQLLQQRSCCVCC